MPHVTPILCPKCGAKTWDGPRYCPSVKGVAFGNIQTEDRPDMLGYTCTNCRFVRYEAPNDRKTALPVVGLRTTGDTIIGTDGERYLTLEHVFGPLEDK